MRVSVIISAYGRPALLARSLELLAHQTHPVQVVVVDDGGEEGTLDVFFPYYPGNWKWVSLRPVGSPPRGPNNVWRAAWELADGDYIITSAPEILAPRDAVERMVAMHVDGQRDVPLLYSLSREHTDFVASHWDIHWVPFLDLTWIESLPGFQAFEGSARIANNLMGGFQHHMMFSGAMRSEWERFGVLPETDEYGFDENWLREREVEAGYPPRLSPVSVYHQWHERVLPFAVDRSPRIRRMHST